MANGPLFFFHNPKAAGSSIRSIIEHQFDEADRSPIIENDKDEHDALGGDYARFRGYRYYGGHFGRDVFDAVAEGHRPITNFRDPLSRIVSLYNFFRFTVSPSAADLATERFFAVRSAKTLSFDRFVSCGEPRIEVYINNHHFRQLTGSCWSLAIGGTLAEARSFIESMPWYYVCEHPDSSASWAHETFGWSLPTLPRENMTVGPADEMVRVSELELPVRRMLYAKNQLDIALYGHAVEGLAQRLSAVNVAETRFQVDESATSGRTA